MKRIAFVGMGVVMGFGAALGVMSAKGADDASAYRQLDLFSDAFEKVRANYVRPVQDKELIGDAVQGMVSSLDPHSSYMNAKSYGDMQITTNGQFGGVGIIVEQEESGLLGRLASAPAEFNAIARVAPCSSVARKSGTACLLVE